MPSEFLGERDRARGNAVNRFLFVLRGLFFVAGVARLRLYRGRRPNSGESGYQKSLTALPRTPNIQ